MYMLYVDESGDSGMKPGSSPYFALSGIVIHESVWHSVLERVICFRRVLRTQYGLKLREEIHAGPFLYDAGDICRIRKDLRLRILRDVLDFQAGLVDDIRILNVIVGKRGKSSTFDPFNIAWTYLIQRFENTIVNGNFPGPRNEGEHGMLIVDRTDEKKLRDLSRRMRRYNPVSNTGGGGYRRLEVQTIIEDPVHRDSHHSYLTQLADVNAYFLYQKSCANKYVRNKGARNWFDRLAPVLCRVASRNDPQGVVRV